MGAVLPIAYQFVAQAVEGRSWPRRSMASNMCVSLLASAWR